MYKIVRDNGFELSSLSVDGQAKVIYKQNRWIYAPSWLLDEGYGVCVFNHLGLAASWLGKASILDAYNETPIYKCICRNKLPLPQMCNIDFLAKGRIQHMNWDWPTATEMFESIKLRQKIPHMEVMEAYNAVL